MTDFQQGVWVGMITMAVVSIPTRIAVDLFIEWWKRRKAVQP